MSSKLKGNVIPGVAIATALMPPNAQPDTDWLHFNSIFSLGLSIYLLSTAFL
jgi:hypothetical protein